MMKKNNRKARKENRKGRRENFAISAKPQRTLRLKKGFTAKNAKKP